MTDKELLDKALNKAVQGGYSKGLAKTYINSPIHQLGVTSIIFCHDFAKAFWGEDFPICEIGAEKIVGYDSPNLKNLKYWQFCLKQMVVQKEPLKYMEKFLHRSEQKKVSKKCHCGKNTDEHGVCLTCVVGQDG